MRRVVAIATAVLALPACWPAVAAAPTPGVWALSAISPATRNAIADYQLKDVMKISGTLPEILVGRASSGPLIINGRQILDLRIINVMLVNRTRGMPPRFGASTGETIDAWTSTVQYGRAPGYGSSVDQWVAMVYYLGPL